MLLVRFLSLLWLSASCVVAAERKPNIIGSPLFSVEWLVVCGHDA